MIMSMTCRTMTLSMSMTWSSVTSADSPTNNINAPTTDSESVTVEPIEMRDLMTITVPESSVSQSQQSVKNVVTSLVATTKAVSTFKTLFGKTAPEENGNNSVTTTTAAPATQINETDMDEEDENEKENEEDEEEEPEDDTNGEDDTCAGHIAKLFNAAVASSVSAPSSVANGLANGITSQTELDFLKTQPIANYGGGGGGGGGPMAVSTTVMSGDRRAKNAGQTVDLYRFVVALKNCTASSIVRSDGLEVLPFGPFLDAASNNCNDLIEEKATGESKKLRSSKLLTVLMRAYAYLDPAKFTTQFSREALKLFLATHDRHVMPTDFAETSGLDGTNTTGGRKSKGAAPLGPGNILLEYAKGLDSFVQNMGRADKTDIVALKFIIEHEMVLPFKMYSSAVAHFANHDLCYEVDTVSKTRDEEVKIPLSNFKRAFVLVTNNVIIQYDGQQPILPPAGLERDLTTANVLALKLKRKEYYLLDLLFSTKIRIIDIVGAQVKDLILPNEYRERLALAGRLFESLKLVQLANANEARYDYSYISKSLTGYDVPHIFFKPNLTAAAIGFNKKQVVLALLDKEGTLVCKPKCSLSGPAALSLLTNPLMRHGPIKGNSNDPPIIRFNGTEYRVCGDLEGTHMFETALAIELKESNKLGNLSHHSPSHLSEYKVPPLPKDAFSMESLKALMSNPGGLALILERIVDMGYLQKSLDFLTSKDSLKDI